MGGVDSVFKQTAAQVHAMAKTADMDLGLTANSYNELATIIGTTLKASGTPLKELAGATDDLITRSADLAATFGGPVTQASEAMASALRGEFEPLRQYGVSLSVAEINSRALADTGKQTAAELTKQEKALATQALIMEASTDAAGAFARENDTLAGKIERAKAVLGNLSAEFGAVFLPAATAAMGYLLEHGVPAMERMGTWAQDNLLPALQNLGAWFLNDGVPRLQEFGTFLADDVVPKIQELASWVTDTLVPALQDMGTWVAQNSAWLLPLAAAVLGAVVAFKAFTIAMAAWKVATTAAAAAQALLNLALLANPIGIVIAVVAGLVAGFLVLWNTNDGFRDAVKTAWAVIKASVQVAWSWLQTLPGRFSDMMSSVQTFVTTGIDRVVSFFSRLPGRVAAHIATMASRLRTEGNAAMDRLKTAVTTGIDRVLTFFRDLPGRITGAVGNLGSVLSTAARQVIDGFIGGLRGGFDRVKSELGKLTNLLPSWKGPPSKDRNILRGAGQLVIGGFVEGMESQYATVRRSLNGLSTDLADHTLELPNTAGGETSPRPGSQTQITIPVQTFERVDPRLIAAEIAWQVGGNP